MNMDLTKDRQPCPKCGKVLYVGLEYHDDRMCWNIFLRKLLIACQGQGWPIIMVEPHRPLSDSTIVKVVDATPIPKYGGRGEYPATDDVACEAESIKMVPLKLDAELWVMAGFSEKLCVLVFDRDVHPACYEKRGYV